MAEVWQDGPPVRLRDLVAITGLHVDTLYQDIDSGDLIARKRRPVPTSPYLIERAHARVWLAKMGLCATVLPASAGTWPVLQPTNYRTPPELAHALAELMGLGSILRSAVATAHRVTHGSDGVQTAVTFEAWTGLDGYGKPTFAVAKTLTAVVERQQRLIRTNTGQDLMSRMRVLVLDPPKAHGATGRTEPIDPRDRLTLPDGTTGLILDVDGVIDPTTERPFAYEVWVG